MRIGDFAVEVVPRGRGAGVREVGSGHVLARPGQVYALRIRNFGPLRCIAEVRIDGRNVSAGGLVIDPGCTEELERPISPDEDGRFTVVAEGDEHVFGPDGGRDNPDLGLIEVHFRRELPRGPERPRPLPPTPFDTLDREPTRPAPHPRLRPEVFPSWNTLASRDPGTPDDSARIYGRAFDRPPSALRMPSQPLDLDRSDDDLGEAGVAERAAGTGLTGHSSQQFTPIDVGPVEKEATIIQLRLVIASAEEIASTPPLVDRPSAPARPAARP